MPELVDEGRVPVFARVRIIEGGVIKPAVALRMERRGVRIRRISCRGADVVKAGIDAAIVDRGGLRETEIGSVQLLVSQSQTANAAVYAMI